MQAIAVAVLLALVGVAIAAPGYEHHDYHDHHPKYKYSYGVNDKHTGDYKTAHETRDGGVTKGSYSVLQPDGILRTVNYVVDGKNGFQAEVVNKKGHGPVYVAKKYNGGGGGGGGGGAGYGYALGNGLGYANLGFGGGFDGGADGGFDA
jgi:hypothetical protein